MRLHGITELNTCFINGRPITIFNTKNSHDPEEKGAFFDNAKKTVIIRTEKFDVNRDIEIEIK